MDVVVIEEDKTFENEVNKSSEEPNHGGKREGAGRPLGSKSKKQHRKNLSLWRDAGYPRV